jgi:hypothetical protein
MSKRPFINGLLFILYLLEEKESDLEIKSMFMVMRNKLKNIIL